jgi:hypothetical protein
MLRRSTPDVPTPAVLAAALLIAACNGGGGGGDDGTSDSNDTTSASDPTAVSDTTDDTSSATNVDDTGTDTGEPQDVTPAPGGLRRLLAHQYVASVELLLGPEAAAAALPPLDPSLGGFDSIAAAELSLSPPDVEQYERSATAIAEAAIENPEVLGQSVPCLAGIEPPDSCFVELARDFGELAWRRPLTDEEIDAYSGVGIAARAELGDGDVMVGAQYMLIALLQSPRFIYIVEIGTAQDDGPRELNQYELATRLSFFLTGRTPTASLLSRAADGELDEDGLRDAAWELLDDPRARNVVARFYDELLTIRDLPTKGKDPELFPQFGEALAASMLEETHRLIEDIVFEQDASVLDLVDADYTFVDDELAALYGVPAPDPGVWAQVQLPAEQNRAGVLTHASVLSMFAHGDLNSPTRRGLFVQEQLLCNEIPPTPPEVVPVLPDVEEPMSLRDRLELYHLTVENCAGCHLQMDPIGFAYEHFDPIGAFRTEDNGFPIDSAAEIDGIGEFANAAELATLVRDDPRLPRCLVNQVYTASLGFPQTDLQAPALDDIGATFVSSDHNMRALLVELATSPLFRLVDEPK